jgi:hypothetical protein
MPKEFVLPHTEMYDEPVHVPEPDVVIFEERWQVASRSAGRRANALRRTGQQISRKFRAR